MHCQIKIQILWIIQQMLDWRTLKAITLFNIIIKISIIISLYRLCSLTLSKCVMLWSFLLVENIQLILGCSSNWPVTGSRRTRSAPSSHSIIFQYGSFRWFSVKITKLNWNAAYDGVKYGKTLTYKIKYNFYCNVCKVIRDNLKLYI